MTDTRCCHGVQVGVDITRCPEAGTILSGDKWYCAEHDPLKWPARVAELEAEVTKWRRIRTPAHGSCCTCQNCGLDYDSCRCDLDDVADELTQTKARLAAIRKVVDEQAEEDGIWFDARTCPEGYLQQELRRLHKVIEGRNDG